MNIDLHSHVIPQRFVDAVQARPSVLQAQVEQSDGKRRIVHDQGYAYPLFDEFVSVDAKLEAMDRKGLDMSVLSPAPPTFTYWADQALATEVVQTVNDGVAEMVAQQPDRLRGMGILPMQHPEAAVTELERIVREHGFKAIEIGTSIENERLSSDRLRPILQKAQELNVYIQTHPYYIGTKPGLEDYYLTNLFGNPYETALMAADLMLSGTLDALPGLRVGLVHGGGFLPYQIGRLVHGHQARTETRANTATSPLDLLRRFYIDTLLFEPKAIRFLVDLVGADRVFLATDAPFDMGDETPVDMIRSVDGITDEDKRMILGGTALSVLGE